ncbi:MAG: TPM domain-containing protein [Clostridia bacterium]|nr:TPM domain-containing protein [Clostridia bacterium]
MKKLLCALMALVLCLMLSACGSSAALKKSEDFYYNDTANVLSNETEAVIYFNSIDLYKACGAQIVVATVTDIGSSTIADYTVKLFNDWEVGDKDKDNGLLLVMLIDRNPDLGNYYLALGSGTTAIISNSRAGDLLDQYLEPYFAEGDYENGAVSIYRALFETVRDYYGINLAFRDSVALRQTGKISSTATYSGGSTVSYGGGSSGGGKVSGSSGGMALAILVIIIVIALLIVIAKASRSRRRVVRTTPVIVGRRVRHTPPPPPPRGPVGGPTVRSRPSSRVGNSFSTWSSGRSTGSSSSRSVFGSGRSSSSRSSGSRSFSSSGRSSFGGGRSGGGRSSGGGAGRR